LHLKRLQICKITSTLILQEVTLVIPSPFSLVGLMFCVLLFRKFHISFLPLSKTSFVIF
jgi:hypothetical protein